VVPALRAVLVPVTGIRAVGRVRRVVPALVGSSVFRRLGALLLDLRERPPHNGGPLTSPSAPAAAAAPATPVADHGALLDALLEASPLAVVGVAADGQIALWSPAAQRMFGWSAEQVLRRTDPLAPGPLAGEARRLLDRALAGQAVNGVEAVRQTLDGTLVTVNVWAVPVRSTASAARVLLLYQDVTERKRTEQQLARQREALHRNEKLADLGRLAAGVAHELRNPLTVIDTRVQLLQRLLGRGGQAWQSLTVHVGYLDEATARMRRIVEGLSSYARPSRAEPVLLEVRDLLAATRDLLGADARRHAVDIVLDVPGRLSPVLGDRSRLMQILVNLATNAIEAMSERGGRLTLRAWQEVAEDVGRVVVEVSDTGPGIPAERIDSIWEPFFTTKAEGTGLGLSIVRSLVEEQPGAALTVRSPAGGGTTFRLSLVASPVADAERAV